jgi:hypothetical protein
VALVDLLPEAIQQQVREGKIAAQIRDEVLQPGTTGQHQFEARVRRAFPPRWRFSLHQCKAYRFVTLPQPLAPGQAVGGF